jgi:hypothetical protein
MERAVVERQIVVAVARKVQLAVAVRLTVAVDRQDSKT